MAELKPCPFCGGEAELNHSITGTYFDVVCKDPYCRGFTRVCNYSTEEKAIEAWNRRVSENE